MSSTQRYVPFGTNARSIGEDSFFEDYAESYQGVDAPDEEHIDPETGLLKIEFETAEIVYRQWLGYGIFPGSIDGVFHVVAAGSPPENVCKILPFIHESVPFVVTSDVGPRNVLNMMRRLGPGGPAVNIYQTTNLRGQQRVINTREPVWEVFARKHGETGRRVFAKVEGADLSYFDNIYPRYLEMAKPNFHDMRDEIAPRTLSGFFASYAMESAADSISDLRYMFTRLFFGMKQSQSDPMESGEVYPFAALLAKNKDDKGYHSAPGTDHAEVPVDEQVMGEMLSSFPIHFDIIPTRWGFRENGDGELIGAMVITGYMLPESSDFAN